MGIHVYECKGQEVPHESAKKKEFERKHTRKSERQRSEPKHNTFPNLIKRFLQRYLRYQQL
jgi:hypothetical protein